MIKYIPKTRPLGGNVTVELDLSNYARKGNLKSAAGVDISKFAKKIDLASLKSEIDKLNIDKLETTPVDLSEASDLVKNEGVKKTVYDELVEKVNAIQVLEADYDTNICEIEKNITYHHHHNKCITTQESNNLTVENFAA